MQCHLRTLSSLYHWNLCFLVLSAGGLLFLLTFFSNPASALFFTFPGPVFPFSLSPTLSWDFQSAVLTQHVTFLLRAFAVFLAKMQTPRGFWVLQAGPQLVRQGPCSLPT